MEEETKLHNSLWIKLNGKQEHYAKYHHSKQRIHKHHGDSVNHRS